ncbi:MAG: phosphoribosylglycinamide formyltransferase [Gammaproteobacteria bacterium]
MKAAPTLGDLGFLASHRGTNVQAVLDACQSGRLGARPAVVIGNNRDAELLARARRLALPAYHLSAETHPEREALDRTIRDTLMRHGVGLVVLAGYMKKLGPETLAQYAGRVINIHPALLPHFGGLGMYGMRVHETVLASGASETGVTIHLVDGDYDRGAILAQCRVPLLPGDSPETLAARVLAREHGFLVETLERILAGELALPGHGPFSLAPAR